MRKNRLRIRSVLTLLSNSGSPTLGNLQRASHARGNPQRGKFIRSRYDVHISTPYRALSFNGYRSMAIVQWLSFKGHEALDVPNMPYSDRTEITLKLRQRGEERHRKSSVPRKHARDLLVRLD